MRPPWREPHWSALGVLALIAMLLGTGSAAAYNLEHDFSKRLIEIRANFRGAELIFFGTAALPPEKVREGERADVIVIIEGPRQTFAVRRKERVNGVWVNGTNLIARDVPSFYFLSSSRPLAEMADPSVLSRYGIGAENIGIVFEDATSPQPAGAAPADEVPSTEGPQADDMLPGGAEQVEEIIAPIGETSQDLKPFETALIRLLAERGSFVSQEGQLQFVRSELFRANVTMPATVPLGAYEARVFLLEDRFVVDAQVSTIYVDKKGFELTIYQLAQRNPILYGVLSVALAAAAGGGAAWAFRRL